MLPLPPPSKGLIDAGNKPPSGDLTSSAAISTQTDARRVIAGGCGNKILHLLRGEADVTLFNLGTSLWDTCATEALLVAAGGAMTTLLGTPINHSASVPTANRLGVNMTWNEIDMLCSVGMF